VFASFDDAEIPVVPFDSDWEKGAGADLTKLPKSDIMSDMKVFTVRDLDRKPGALLDICDREGSVRIRRRDGKTYTLQSEGAVPISALPDFERRVRQLFQKPLAKRQVRRLDDALAGE